MFREIQKNAYSVRKVEELVRQLKSGGAVQIGKKHIAGKSPRPEQYVALRQQLSDVFSTRVELTCSPKGKGKISIPFANADELEKIRAVIDRLQ